MKTKFLIIGAIALTAIILSGCFWQEGKEEKKPEQKSEEINADTILDNKLFEDAVSSNDASRCEEIKSSVKKGECKITLQSLDLMRKAAELKDKSLCSQIKLERYKTTCEINIVKLIAAEKAEQEKEEELKKQDEERLKTEQEAVEQQNPAICDKISDLNHKSTCKFNAIINKAHEEKNPELCKQIGEEDRIKQCIDFAS